MDDKKNYNTIDFLRIIFTIGVIVGHTYVILYWDRETVKIPAITCQNMCVDVFFIISGFFMARSIEKLKKSISNPVETFATFNFSRIKRLYPIYIVTFFIFCLLNLKKDLINYWPTFFMLAGINKFPNIYGTWYVASLFYVGLIISGAIIFSKEKTVCIYLPIISFVAFSHMYAVHGNLSLNSNPIEFNWCSCGNIKALCGLSIGCELFYFTNHFQKFVTNFDKRIKNILSIILEILGTCIIALCFIKGGVNRLNFLIYPGVLLLLLVFCFREEKIFSFTKFPIFYKPAKYTYAVYLTHEIVIRSTKYLPPPLRQFAIQGAGKKISYASIVLVSFVFGIILQELFTVCINKLKKNIHNEGKKIET